MTAPEVERREDRVYRKAGGGYSTHYHFWRRGLSGSRCRGSMNLSAESEADPGDIEMGLRCTASGCREAWQEWPEPAIKADGWRVSDGGKVYERTEPKDDEDFRYRLDCKPCPFCGSERLMSVLDFDRQAPPAMYFVSCSDLEGEDMHRVGCNAHGPDGTSHEEALRLWNERT